MQGEFSTFLQQTFTDLTHSYSVPQLQQQIRTAKRNKREPSNPSTAHNIRQFNVVSPFYDRNKVCKATNCHCPYHKRIREAVNVKFKYHPLPKVTTSNNSPNKPPPRSPRHSHQIPQELMPSFSEEKKKSIVLKPLLMSKYPNDLPLDQFLNDNQLSLASLLKDPSRHVVRSSVRQILSYIYHNTDQDRKEIQNYILAQQKDRDLTEFYLNRYDELRAKRDSTSTVIKVTPPYQNFRSDGQSRESRFRKSRKQSRINLTQYSRNSRASSRRQSKRLIIEEIIQSLENGEGVKQEQIRLFQTLDQVTFEQNCKFLKSKMKKLDLETLQEVKTQVLGITNINLSESIQAKKQQIDGLKMFQKLNLLGNKESTSTQQLQPQAASTKSFAKHSKSRNDSKFKPLKSQDLLDKRVSKNGNLLKKKGGSTRQFGAAAQKSKKSAALKVGQMDQEENMSGDRAQNKVQTLTQEIEQSEKKQTMLIKLIDKIEDKIRRGGRSSDSESSQEEQDQVQPLAYIQPLNVKRNSMEQRKGKKGPGGAGEQRRSLFSTDQKGRYGHQMGTFNKNSSQQGGEQEQDEEDMKFRRSHLSKKHGDRRGSVRDMLNLESRYIEISADGMCKDVQLNEIQQHLNQMETKFTLSKKERLRRLQTKIIQETKLKSLAIDEKDSLFTVKRKARAFKKLAEEKGLNGEVKQECKEFVKLLEEQNYIKNRRWAEEKMRNAIKMGMELQKVGTGQEEYQTRDPQNLIRVIINSIFTDRDELKYYEVEIVAMVPMKLHIEEQIMEFITEETTRQEFRKGKPRKYKYIHRHLNHDSKPTPETSKDESSDLVQTGLRSQANAEVCYDESVNVMAPQRVQDLTATQIDAGCYQVFDILKDLRFIFN